MNNTLKNIPCSVFIIFFFLLFLTACERERLPRLKTSQVTNIEPNSAASGGEITNDGNSDIIVRGVCWDTRKSPDIEDARTTDGYGIGLFTSTIAPLNPNTLYYVRAYATNSVGTAYGNQLTFTSAQMGVATLTTNTVSAITQTSAVSGGNITSDGGADITERGVCWSTDSPPIIDDNKTIDGAGTGNFTSNMTELTGNTIYYVRAYAINSQGIAYGQETSFTTGPVLPVVITVNPVPTSTTTGLSGGNVTGDGGSPVIARGVCWSRNQNPVIGTNSTNDGTGTGSYESNITGLTANTLYHVRAYATNSVGTAYGEDHTFRTDPATVQDFDGNIYTVIRIGTQLWMKENLKTTSFNNGTSIAIVSNSSSWAGLSDPGMCWYSNNENNKDVYGGLYNWYAVDAGNLCPVGWHVPTDDDYLTLERYDNSVESTVGGKLKETGTIHWTSPNTGATNEWDFTALPGGMRTSSGIFEYIHDNGHWWTSSEYSGSESYARRLQHDSARAYRTFTNNKTGKSVRCIKN